MPVIYEDEHIVVDERPERRVVLVRRKRTRPETPEVLIEGYQEALGLNTGRHRGWGLVLDMREALGRTDQDFERAMAPLQRHVRRVYARVVLLVATAAGELHSHRIAREQGFGTEVTRDEDEAIALAAGAPEDPVPRSNDRKTT
ncbi:MAG: hypothetical protein KF729_27970 [Sandaracinaceae bacterium]|nr:hypothetical protein [Sandaracinaceae bacterium]